MTWINILAMLFSGLLATLLTGIFFNILENIQKTKELISILIALKNECDYNSIHRGSVKSPFQILWLGKALSILEFYEQCEETFTKKCLDVFELAKDANSDNLNRRGMVPSNVQHEMISIASSIEKILPDLKKCVKFWNYILKKVLNLVN